MAPASSPACRLSRPRRSDGFVAPRGRNGLCDLLDAHRATSGCRYQRLRPKKPSRARTRTTIRMIHRMLILETPFRGFVGETAAPPNPTQADRLGSRRGPLPAVPRTFRLAPPDTPSAPASLALARPRAKPVGPTRVCRATGFQSGPKTVLVSRAQRCERGGGLMGGTVGSTHRAALQPPTARGRGGTARPTRKRRRSRRSPR
jgi:hypothetical protein